MNNKVSTTCMRCAVGCGHVFQRDENEVEGVQGDPTHPVSKGLACSRGIRESWKPEGERLTKPLVRSQNKFHEASWQEALSRATSELKKTYKENPNSIAILGSGQQTNEAAYSLGKLARGGFGTRNYDANTTLCMASAVTAYYQAFGSDAPPCTYEDIPQADRHIIWGANPSVAHPVMFKWIQRSASEGETEIIVVDPVHTETAVDAEYHIAPQPGRDLALARGVFACLVESNRIDEEFVKEATEGFKAVCEMLPSVEKSAAEAGVNVEDIELLADALNQRALLYWGMGINQHVQGTETARALIDLTLATGNLRPGTGPFSLTGQANSMGSRVCSSKGTWPGQRAFDESIHRQVVADHWGIPVETLPDKPGLGPVGILDEEEVDVIWTVATNPAAGFPNAEKVREILEDKFVITQDAFHTETTELADLVLPAATWGETEGTTTNMERTISRVRKVIEPPSDAWPDLSIIATIGKELFPNLFSNPRPAPAAIFDEFTSLTEGTVADCSGITYERLRKEHAIRWPAPDEESSGGYRYYEDGEWVFPTSTGVAQFSAGRQEPLPEQVDGEFPLTLTTAREADSYNTGVRSRGVEGEKLVARIHPKTLSSHEETFTDGIAIIVTRRSSVKASLKQDECIPPGLIWLPIHHPSTNRLTLPICDPESHEPHYKQCAGDLALPSTER